MSDSAVLKRLMVLVIHCNFSEYPTIICWLCSKWTLSYPCICSKPPRFPQKRALSGQRNTAWVEVEKWCETWSKSSHLTWLVNKHTQPKTIQQWLYRVSELEGTFKGHLVQPSSNEQRHPQPDQVAQGLVQPGLGCLQGCGIHPISVQPVPDFNRVRNWKWASLPRDTEL